MIYDKELYKLMNKLDKYFTVKDEDTIAVQSYHKLFKDNGLMLAGGTINSIFSDRAINDLDFYFKELVNGDKSYVNIIVQELKDIYGYKVVCTTANAITLTRGKGSYKQDIQLITRFYGTPETILNTFDFTIVQGIYDFATSNFELGDRFLIDIARRKLEYTTTSQYPICALFRTKKYQERGYTLSGGNIVALSLAIHALDIPTYKELKEQLLGIDTAMFTEITKDYDDNKRFEMSEFVIEWLDKMNVFNDDNGE